MANSSSNSDKNQSEHIVIQSSSTCDDLDKRLQKIYQLAIRRYGSVTPKPTINNITTEEKQ